MSDVLFPALIGPTDWPLLAMPVQRMHGGAASLHAHGVAQVDGARHPFARLCQAAEDAAYRDADVVVSMLPKVQQHMAARGLDLAKLHVVPNGITPPLSVMRKVSLSV